MSVSSFCHRQHENSPRTTYSDTTFGALNLKKDHIKKYIYQLKAIFVSLIRLCASTCCEDDMNLIGTQ